MKTAAPKARRYWLTRKEGEMGELILTTKSYPTSDPVLVIPDDPASREALVERMAKAIQKAWEDGDGYVNSLDEARAALAAIRK